MLIRSKDLLLGILHALLSIMQLLVEILNFDLSIGLLFLELGEQCLQGRLLSLGGSELCLDILRLQILETSLGNVCLCQGVFGGSHLGFEILLQRVNQLINFSIVDLVSSLPVFKGVNQALVSLVLRDELLDPLHETAYASSLLLILLGQTPDHRLLLGDSVVERFDLLDIPLVLLLEGSVAAGQILNTEIETFNLLLGTAFAVAEDSCCSNLFCLQGSPPESLDKGVSPGYEPPELLRERQSSESLWELSRADMFHTVEFASFDCKLGLHEDIKCSVQNGLLADLIQSIKFLRDRDTVSISAIGAIGGLDRLDWCHRDTGSVIRASGRVSAALSPSSQRGGC
ncbi:hypothetical protein N7541_006533 [Penicillium brevicompactum]|uniref:Uncharacterized protein n=1 Tax=Penicillium brevicompactum TaxID=5074 RepID=A0A9W9R795_PENBR|nr:hypothetical protein N7541_006533 [Penicillium brevicompactum]